MSQDDNIFEEALKSKLSGHRSDLSPAVWDKIISEVGDKNFRPPTVEPKRAVWRKRLPLVILLVTLSLIFIGLFMFTTEEQPEKSEPLAYSASLKDPLSGNTDRSLHASDQVTEAHAELKNDGHKSWSKREANSENELSIGADKYVLQTKRKVRNNTVEARLNPTNTSRVKQESTEYDAALVSGSDDKEPTGAGERLDVHALRDDVHHQETMAWDSDQRESMASPSKEEMSFPVEKEEDSAVDSSTKGGQPESVLDVEASEDSFVSTISDTTAVLEDNILTGGIPEPADSSEETYRKWSMAFMAGPSYTYRIFRSSNDVILEDHKNQHENSLLTYSYAGMLSYRIKPKIRVQAGLMYLRVGEQYAYSSAHASHSATNRYDYLSFPIGVDYSQGLSDQLDLVIGTGVQMSYLRKGISSWVNPHSFEAQAHEHEGDASPFATKTFGVNGRVGIRYQVHDRLHLLVHEQAFLFTSSIYKKETGLDQRSYAFQTYVGLGYTF